MPVCVPKELNIIERKLLTLLFIKVRKNGAKMDTTTTLNELYKILHSKGIVATRKEFHKDWLNRSECYFRYLKSKNKLPSADTLAICSSKLKHYSLLLAKTQHKNLARDFTSYSKRLDEVIFANAQLKWVELMQNSSNNIA